LFVIPEGNLLLLLSVLVVILSAAKNPRICIVSAVALGISAVASEIGPGFSPDSAIRHVLGL
jgi:hypothetical protein